MSTAKAIPAYVPICALLSLGLVAVLLVVFGKIWGRRVENYTVKDLEREGA